MPEIKSFRLDPNKRVLFLTKDPELIRRQIRGELDLKMEDLSVEDLLDDINTDAMTPAWVCFDHEPDRIAQADQRRAAVAMVLRYWGSTVVGSEVVLSSTEP